MSTYWSQNTADPVQEIKRQKELEGKYQEIQDKMKMIKRKHRTIRSGWRTNIVGIEQLGDSSSNLYNEQLSAYESQKNRSD